MSVICSNTEGKHVWGVEVGRAVEEAGSYVYSDALT